MGEGGELTSNLRVRCLRRRRTSGGLDGEAPVAVDVGEPVRFARHVREHGELGANDRPTNLTHSDSGCVLRVRGGGGGYPNPLCRASIPGREIRRFAQLLTSNLGHQIISRMSYYNCPNR